MSNGMSVNVANRGGYNSVTIHGARFGRVAKAISDKQDFEEVAVIGRRANDSGWNVISRYSENPINPTDAGNIIRHPALNLWKSPLAV